jgi:hypothetical protein
MDSLLVPQAEEVQDRRERRKMQNRIAQRNYRKANQEPLITASC